MENNKNESWLFQELKPEEKPQRERVNKAQEIRTLSISGISDKEISEKLTCSESYVRKVKSSMDEFNKRQQEKRITRKCNNLLVGEKFTFRYRTLEFIKYMKDFDGEVYVHFTNENDKHDNMKLSELIHESLQAKGKNLSEVSS